MAQPEKKFPPQYQEREPGLESEMTPEPRSRGPEHRGSGKLENRVALITGGDSGIGRAVAIAFAREGADVAIVYLDEHGDAEETKRLVEEEGRLGGLHVLVNNAAEQHPQESIEEIDSAQLERTFRTNIFSYFYMTKAALPHLEKGSAIVNTTSVTAYKGSPKLLDYSSTKGAIVTFTRSLALALVERGIRVNGVAPGPIWTPLIPSTFPEEKVESFGSDVPMKRAGQPEEVAPAFVFLASEDAAYMAGQILHVNGGEVVNG